MSASKPPLGARPSRNLDPRREDDGAPPTESFESRPSPPLDRAPRRAIVEERVAIPPGAEERLRRRPIVEEHIGRPPVREESVPPGS